jgi:hypothetical protein
MQTTEVSYARVIKRAALEMKENKALKELKAWNGNISAIRKNLMLSYLGK